jgi:hypothetical protein
MLSCEVATSLMHGYEGYEGSDRDANLQRKFADGAVMLLFRSMQCRREYVGQMKYLERR